MLEALRSQRISLDLNTGRAWVDHELQSINISSLEKEQNPTLRVSGLAEVQSVLLSKISVDPHGYDAFYHLGGVSFLLARQALQEKNLDWSASAKPMLKNTLRYAQDIAPSDVRTAQLESLMLDLAKF